MNNPPRMLPGSEPYTDAEWSRVRSLISDACEASEIFTADELEDTQRDHEGNA